MIELEKVLFSKRIKEQNIKKMFSTLKKLKKTNGNCSNIPCDNCPLNFISSYKCWFVRVGTSSTIIDETYPKEDLEKWNKNRKLIKKALKKLDKDSN